MRGPYRVRYRVQRSASLVILIAVSTWAMAAPEVPAGWRVPERRELSDSGDSWRESDPTLFQRVVGDFDGDGRQDRAELLVSIDSSSFGLFVSFGDGKRRWLVKEQAVFLLSMGIAKVEPSSFATACGKGYWECAMDEPETLHLPHDGIEYFKSESASSVFFWSPARKAFRRVWVSD